MNILEIHCLCGSKSQYAACCQPFHTSEQQPSTAEWLMRSRFTAYAMQNETYLLKTWDTSKCPKEIDFSKEQVKWTKLEIIKTKKGTEKDNKGIIEFKAYYIQNDEEYVMNELSRFNKVAGCWLYVDGLIKSVEKVGQQFSQSKNAPCTCGSEKKFKRCCGKSL